MNRPVRILDVALALAEIYRVDPANELQRRRLMTFVDAAAKTRKAAA